MMFLLRNASPFLAFFLCCAFQRVWASGCLFSGMGAGNYVVSESCTTGMTQLSGILTLVGSTSSNSPSTIPPALNVHHVVTAANTGSDNGRHFRLNNANSRLYASHLQFYGGRVNSNDFREDCGDGRNHGCNRGAVVEVQNGYAEFTSSVFAGCGHQHCAKNGGTFSFKNSGASGLFTRCLFTGTGSNGRGGIGFLYNGGSVELVDSILENGSGVYMGAIGIRKGTLHAIGTVFRDNKVVCSGCTDTNHGGGAIGCELGCSVTVESSTFLRNTHYGRGGAINGALAPQNLASPVVIRNSFFEDNTAQLGGAVAYESTPSANQLRSMVVTGSTFHRNVAAIGGGGLYIVSITAEILMSTFQKNVAGIDGGGGLYLSSKADDVVPSIHTIGPGCVFEANSVNKDFSGSGGGLVASGSGVLNITESTFRANEAGGQGGDGGAFRVMGLTTPMYVIGGKIDANKAPRGRGGGIAVSDLTGGLFISSSVDISNNVATLDGGGIDARGNIPIFHMNDTILQNNTVQARMLAEQGWSVRMFSQTSGHPRTCQLPNEDFLATAQATKTGTSPKIQHMNRAIQYVDWDSLEPIVLRCENTAPFGTRLPVWEWSVKLHDTVWPEEEFGCLDFDFDEDGDEGTCAVGPGDPTDEQLSAAEFSALYIAPMTGEYKFLMDTNKIAAFSIDGSVVILDNNACWGNGGSQTHGTASLVAGTMYSLSVRWGDGGESGWIYLVLKLPGSNSWVAFRDVFHIPAAAATGSCEGDQANGISAPGRGGGLFIAGGDVKLRLFGGRIEDNKAVNGIGGGGIALYRTAKVELIGNVSIVRNSVSANSENTDSGKGGGILIDQSSNVVIDAVVEHNKVLPTETTEHGAGLHSIKSQVSIEQPGRMRWNLGGRSSALSVGFPVPSAQCPPGYFFPYGTEAWGALLEADDGRANHICRNCPIGWYNSEIGAVACSKCTAGLYSAVSALDTCTSCDFGQYRTSTMEASVCDLCPAGYHQNVQGQASCLPCIPGKANNLAGQAECTKCAMNTFSLDSNATACIDCGIGEKTVGNGSASCQPCPAGEAGTPCTSCDFGQYRTSIMEASVCDLCPAGYHQNVQGQASCLPCIPGKANNLAGQAECTKCAMNTFSLDSNATACIDCGIGEKTVGNGSASCQPCPAGEAGTPCTSCDFGQYRTSIMEASVCDLCPAGYHQNVQGQASCLPCIPGKANNLAGQAECTKCAMNTFSPDSNATACIDCGIGEKTVGNGSASCQPCPAGEAGTPCTSCDFGQYRTSIMEASVCDLCPAGYHQNVQGQASCLPCIPGKANNLAGQAECTKCAMNTFSPDSNATACIDCGIGEKTVGNGSASCQPCPAGEAGTPCKTCTPGYYRKLSDDPDFCLQCDKGKYSSEYGQAGCLSCIPGKSNSMRAQTKCKHCNVGQFANETQQYYCTRCQAGMFSGAAGSTRCQDCAAGKYQNERGAEKCTHCLPGMFRSNEDVSARRCQNCSAGYFTLRPGQPFCLACDAGKFAADNGTSGECTACPRGRYEDAKRSPGPCKVCEDSQMRPNPQKTSCTLQSSDPRAPTTEMMRIDPGFRYTRKRRLNKEEHDGMTTRLTIRIHRSEQETSTRENGSIVLPDDRLEVLASSRTDFTGATSIVLSPDAFEIIAETPPKSITVAFSVSAPPTESSNTHSGGTIWHHQMYYKVRVLQTDADAAGSFSNRNDAWVTASRCNDEEYLKTYPGNGIDDDGSRSETEAKPLFIASTSFGSSDSTPVCAPCPEGADCIGAKTWDETTNLAGYQALPWDPRGYGRCPQPLACRAGDDRFRNGSNRSGAASERGTSCIEGHTGALCAQCIEGYTVSLASGGAETCSECPDSAHTYLAMTGLVAVGGCVIAFLVYDSLNGIAEILKAIADKSKHSEGDAKTNEGAQIPFHSVGIRIISSYLQVAGLLRNFKVTMPPSVKALVTVQGAAGGIGGQVISYACLLPQTRGNNLFFVKQFVTIILMPAVLVCAVSLFWLARAYCCGKCCVKPELHNTKVKYRDKALGSLVVLFYLLFPSIMTAVTSMLQCTSYGQSVDSGDDFRVEMRALLDAELSIECFEPRHTVMVLTIALPGMLCFVIILPLLLVYAMRRHARRHELFSYQSNFDPAISYRYGFLFLGYQDNTYAWEILIMVRKASFVVISGFLRTYGPIAQVVGAVSILIVSLSLQLRFTPYECDGHDKMESLSLHSCLFILMTVLLSGAVSSTTGDDIINGRLGPVNTVVVILCVFAATLLFFLVSNFLILSHSHKNTGMLGKCARLCTKKSLTKLHHEATLGKSSHTGTGIRIRRNKIRRQKTLDLVQKVVVHDVASKTVANASGARAKAIFAIQQREAAADARVRKRLQDRRSRRKKLSKVTPAEIRNWEHKLPDPSSGPVMGDKIEKVRQLLARKMGKMKRLNAVFEKLDLDQNGMLSKKEFGMLIEAALHSKQSKIMIHAMWEAAWDMRKHGGEDEMDAATLGHWLQLVP